MERIEVVIFIKKEKLVAILRAKRQQDVESVVAEVFSVGINVLEITSNTPGYLEEITKARKAHPNKLIGCGTVINVQIARKAINAGAQFLVTPNTDVEVIQFAHKFNIPILVGALTPTEVCLAHENGADIVKLFPADIFGPSYLKAIMGPFNNF